MYWILSFGLLLGCPAVEKASLSALEKRKTPNLLTCSLAQTSRKLHMEKLIFIWVNTIYE